MIRDYAFVGTHLLNAVWRKPLVKVNALYLPEVLWLMMLGHVRIAHQTNGYLFIYLNRSAA